MPSTGTFRNRFSVMSSEGFQVSSGQKQSLSREERSWLISGFSWWIQSQRNPSRPPFRHPPQTPSLPQLSSSSPSASPFCRLWPFPPATKGNNCQVSQACMHNLEKEETTSRNPATETQFFLVWRTSKGWERPTAPRGAREGQPPKDIYTEETCEEQDWTKVSSNCQHLLLNICQQLQEALTVMKIQLCL